MEQFIADRNKLDRVYLELHELNKGVDEMRKLFADVHNKLIDLTMTKAQTLDKWNDPG